MSIASLAQYIGKDITINDPRTEVNYTCKILDVREVWGRLDFSVQSGKWFSPNYSELKTVG